MTVSFTQFGGKALTTQSDRTEQKDVVGLALQKLNFNVLLVCFLIKKKSTFRHLDSAKLDITNRNLASKEKNDPLHMLL